MEEGKVANLLLMRENPLDTVEAWSTLEVVVVRGVVVERDDLSARRR